MTDVERRIDERLRRAYAPPADAGPRARRIVERARAEEDRPASWLHGFAAAAALLVGGLAPLWWPGPGDDAPTMGLVAQVSETQRLCSDPRADVLAHELDPMGLFSCNLPGAGAGAPEFQAAACTSPGLAFSSWPEVPGLTGLVWSAEPEVILTGPEPWRRAPGGRLLRLRRGAEQGLVLVHPASEAPRFDGAPTDAIHVHRREVGAWVLHELSGALTPRFLPLFASNE